MKLLSNTWISDHQVAIKELIFNYPFFKHRDNVDTDFIIGCPVGCRFCIYRMIKEVDELMEAKKTRRLATPESYQLFITRSKVVVRDKTPIIIGARVDASAQILYTKKWLEIFEWKNPVLLLHRVPFNQELVELALSDERIILGTTITPNAYKLGWTVIKEEDQIKSIEYALNKGVKACRISVEVGPINETNFHESKKIIEKLDDIGLEFVIVRGVSLGDWMIRYDKRREELERIGFITNGIRGKIGGSIEPSYYKIKNYIPYNLLRELYSLPLDIKIYRFNVCYYGHHLKRPVKRFRFNKEREFCINMCPYSRSCKYFDTEKNVSSVEKALQEIGVACEACIGEDGFVHVRNEVPITEDEVYYVFYRTGTSVIVDGKYLRSPTHDIIRRWFENDFLFRGASLYPVPY